MRELKIGERIPIEAGGEAVVSRELGRGGQGIVYLVRYNGREYVKIIAAHKLHLLT